MIPAACERSQVTSPRLGANANASSVSAIMKPTEMHFTICGISYSSIHCHALIGHGLGSVGSKPWKLSDSLTPPQGKTKPSKSMSSPSMISVLTSTPLWVMVSANVLLYHNDIAIAGLNESR
jgi:hypothetical protein